MTSTELDTCHMCGQNPVRAPGKPMCAPCDAEWNEPPTGAKPSGWLCCKCQTEIVPNPSGVCGTCQWEEQRAASKAKTKRPLKQPDPWKTQNAKLVNLTPARWRQVVYKHAKLDADDRTAIPLGFVLAHCAQWEDGSNVRPGKDALRELINLSLPTIGSYIKVHVDYGLLRHVRWHNGRGGLADEYRLSAPAHWVPIRWGGTLDDGITDPDNMA